MIKKYDKKDLTENIKYILKETIGQINIKYDLQPISYFIYYAFKSINNKFILDFIIDEIKNFYGDKILDFYPILEKKQDFPIKCKNKFLDYLNIGNNCESIKILIEKSQNKNEILKRISNELIIKVSNLSDLENIINNKNDTNINKENYESYLLLNSLKKDFEECNTEINYIKKSKKILDELKQELKNINYTNYKKAEKLIKNKNLVDFLYFKDEEKKNDIEMIKIKIKKFKFFNIGFIILLIAVVLSLFLSQITISNNKEFKYELTENNWNIFNKSKELVKSEYDKYSFVIDSNTKSGENKNNYNNINLDNPENKIIIGIDFGSINTGYSYYIKSKKTDNKILKIESSEKTPNEIEISKRENKGTKYAYKASVSLANYRYEEIKEINFIKGIKTLMNNKTYYSDNLCYVYPNNFIVNMNITHVIKEYFTLIKNDIFQMFKKDNININNYKIKWIFSVPQNWDEFEKQIILNSAIDSGMSDITLMYESEAAGLSLFINKNIPDNFIKRKNNFILIDIGGINTKFSIYDMNKDQIKEKIQIKNNILENIGLLHIVEKIINVLEIILGKNNINDIKREQPGNWIKILKDIHKAIEDTNRINGIELFDIYIPLSSQGIYEYKYENGNILKKFKIKYEKYNLQFPSGLISEFILQCSQKIIFNINNIISELKLKKIGIDNLVITGGLSKNIIIKEEIKKNFIEDNQINIHYLSNYQNTISRGGVFYGLNITKINSRFSQETIGIKIDKIIKTLLTKGKNMNNNFTEIMIIKPSKLSQKKIQINIYSSNKKEILEENDFIGSVIIYLDNSNYPIKFIINYDVALRFQAYEVKTGKKIKIKFEYFK